MSAAVLLFHLAAPGLARSEARGILPPPEGAVRVGDQAPRFALKSLSGQAVRIEDSLGRKPILIVFWSYFCFPCQRELPALEELYREIGPENLAVIGISLDGVQYDQRIVPFVKEKGITFPMAYDRETDEFFEVAERYGVVGTPTYFLLDLQGRVRLIHLGRLEKELLVGAVKGVRDQAFCSEITKPEAPPRSGGAARSGSGPGGE